MTKPEKHKKEDEVKKKRSKQIENKTQELEQTIRDDLLSFLNKTQQEREELQESIILNAYEEHEDLFQDVDEWVTNFNIDQIILCSRIYLEIDMVIAIIYYSLQLVGAKWITLYDIARYVYISCFIYQ